MRRDRLQAFRAWFEEYVKGFYSEDPVSRTGIALKEGHTRRVCENIVRIGASISLGEEDLILAETIALLHDVGRFGQFALYRTFNDRRTENHALLGLRELNRAGVLSSLGEEEREIVAGAIECHNMVELPPDLPGRRLLFSRLIRDADKLDILEMSASESDRPVMNAFLPDTPGCSPALLEDLLSGRRCHYDQVKNSNDRKLLLISWVYDINFAHTFAEIKQRGLINKIMDSLPGGKDILAVRRHVEKCLNNNSLAKTL